jgi:DNA invertase Pin-like site-specific DNA recombinase
MHSVLEELRFNGVRVVSVTDGLDTDDEESAVGIQIRGIFNELQLTDLRKKTFRGQLGQKQRGFVVARRPPYRSRCGWEQPSSSESSAVSLTSSSSWPRAGGVGRWVTPSSRPSGASTL